MNNDVQHRIGQDSELDAGNEQWWRHVNTEEQPVFNRKLQSTRRHGRYVIYGANAHDLITNQKKEV